MKSGSLHAVIGGRIIATGRQQQRQRPRQHDDERAGADE